MSKCPQENSLNISKKPLNISKYLSRIHVLKKAFFNPLDQFFFSAEAATYVRDFYTSTMEKNKL